MKLINFDRIMTNGRRICRPECTVDRIRQGFDRFGIIPHVTLGQTHQNFCWCIVYVAQLRDKTLFEQKKIDFCREKNKIDFQFCSAGKGSSYSFAEASGLAEFAERYQTFCFYKEPKSKIKIELSDLVSSDKIHLFDQFVDDKVFGMQVDAYSLNREEYIRIPEIIMEMISGSNGLASGNTIEEAIIQGSMEIFERFTTIKACSEGESVPTYDLSLITDARILEMIAFLEMNGIDILIKDLSYGIFPSVGVVFHNKNVEGSNNPFKRDRILELSCAASFSFEEALMRCFTEYCQGITSEQLKYRNSDDYTLRNFNILFPGIEYSAPQTWFFQFRFHIAMKDISHLQSGDIVKEIPKIFLEGSSVLEEIKEISNIAIKVGSEVLVVDMTNDIIDFPSVRVIMPMLSDVIKYDVLHHSIFDSLQLGKWKQSFAYKHLANLTDDTAKLYIYRFSTSVDEFNRLSSLCLDAKRRLIFHYLYHKVRGGFLDVYNLPSLEKRIIEFLNGAAR